MPYLCNACFHLSAVEEKAEIVCEKCHHVQSFDTYKSAIQEVRKAVTFGYQYRAVYEQDFKNHGKLNRRYALNELSEVFVWLGGAVVSGIAGNWAYDQIKEVIHRIIADAIELRIRDKEFKKLLTDETEMEKFIQYITEYRNNTVTAPDEVQKVIGIGQYMRRPSNDLPRDRIAKPVKHKKKKK